MVEQKAEHKHLQVLWHLVEDCVSVVDALYVSMVKWHLVEDSVSVVDAITMDKFIPHQLLARLRMFRHQGSI